MNLSLNPPEIFRVSRVNTETEDTFTWEITPLNGNVTKFQAGQFNMLYLFGAGEAPISISGDPSIEGRLVHTTRAVGSITKAMKRMKTGGTVGIRGPFGNGWPIAKAEGCDVILIAGGIGIAPLRSALYTLQTNRSRFGKIIVLYGARAPEDILFRKELERWRGRLDLEVNITVDHAARDWRGNVGFVTSLIPKIQFDEQQAVAMICGPEIMMRFAALELMKTGMEPSDIFVSLERNMKCAVGLCGHCQLGPFFVCKDGPVFSYDRVQSWLSIGEI